MTPTMLVVLVAAVVINVLTYGGIAAVYFADKHRVDPARPAQTATPTSARRARPSAASSPVQDERSVA